MRPISDRAWNRMAKMTPAKRAAWYARLTPEERAAWDAKGIEMGVRALQALNKAFEDNAAAARQTGEAIARLGEALLRL